ncbi:MAG TPA: 16S rRNA (cytidine(1402)-2'-O)-methyltransferase [Vicinamibacterales bacterium]|nr:16S rRNA (cytidine(1402)-2'-O)-methyltransferase [Acidobacteriota bacterium]HOC19036.1 16S rRNA (cytidine(1402)-2'-O)-methyltransferase [Vicinamibacterales bacterium]
MPGTLFVVATPIGNLEDITSRALRVLREAALIAAEDTRHTGRLLAHFAIPTPTTSFYEQNEREKLPRLLERLRAGDNIALVSDAGTPAVSDPGYRLVQAAAAGGIRVEAIPGPSAILAALVASGLPTNAFTFLGFPPARAAARDRWLADLGARRETTIFFEAPHRVRATLEAAARILGSRPAAICRELTKLHEEVLRGPLADLVRSLPNPRGEFTIVIGPAEGAEAQAGLPGPDELLTEFGQLTDEGLDRRAAISELAKRYQVSSREVYAAVEQARAAAEGLP